MSEFKVGDRVRFTAHSSAILQGAVGTLVAPETNHGWLARIPNALNESTEFVGDWEIEKIAPTFKVGDRVRVTDKYPGRDVHGLEGVVSKVDPRWTYPVRADVADEGVLLFHFDELELMQSEPAPTGITLRAGDKIRNRITGREGYVYPAPIARMLKVYDAKPPYRDGVPAAAVEEYEFHHPGTYELVLRGQGEVF